MKDGRGRGRGRGRVRGAPSLLFLKATVGEMLVYYGSWGCSWLMLGVFCVLLCACCMVSGCSACSARLQTPLNYAGRQAWAAPAAAPPQALLPQASRSILMRMGWEAAWRPVQARAHRLLGARRHSQWCCRPGIIPFPTLYTRGSAASPPWSPWGTPASTWPTSPANSASSNTWCSMDSYPFWVPTAAAAAGAGRGWPRWGPACRVWFSNTCQAFCW